MAISVSEFVRFEDRVSIAVFVVSPNQKLRQEIQQKLNSPRWRVVEAGGGAEALELIRSEGSGGSVLLLDPMLPDLDPGEFHGIVRAGFQRRRSS